MAVSSRVIVAGTPMTVTERSGVAKASGEPWSIREVVIVDTTGVGCIAEVAFRGGDKLPEVGKHVQLLATVGVYRDSDTLNFEKYL